MLNTIRQFPYRRIGAHFFTILLCLCIVSCAGSQGSGTFGQNDTEREAMRLAAAGQHRAAADTYWRLAQRTRNELQQQAYQLSAIDYLLRAGVYQEARNRLSILYPMVQDPMLKTRAEFLYARLDAALGNPDAAMRRLDQLGAQGFPSSMQQSFYLTRINILKAQGKEVEALYEQIRLNMTQQSDAQAIRQSHQQIWNALFNLTPTQLRLAPKVSPNTQAGHALSGWIELAVLSKTVLPEAFGQAINDWRRRFPEHPAEYSIVPGLLKARRPPPTKREAVHHLAVMLPLSGKLAEAAAAVREGIMAAFFQEEIDANMTIRVYDTHNQDIGVLYERALDEGAYAIIGPLEKETVATLVNTFYPTLPRPTLALNEVYLSGQPPSQFFQFALTPEAEAREVAERIWAEGHRSASALFPDSEWGERVRRAFELHWQQLGGELFTYTRYQSKNLASAVETLVKQIRYVESFEDDETGQMRSVWRSRAKAMFVAGFPVQMRQLRPQFKYFDAPGDLVFYTTSHAYAGQPSPKNDHDLNGIRFPDMPWRLVNELENTPPGALFAGIKRHWKEGMSDQRKRLYAFGVDAFRLIKLIAKQRDVFEQIVNGETGQLSIARNGVVQRELLWAKFEDGQPSLLGSPVPIEDKLYDGDTPDENQVPILAPMAEY